MVACRFIFPPQDRNKHFLDDFSLEAVPERNLSLFPSIGVGEMCPTQKASALRDRGYARNALTTHFQPAMQVAQAMMR